MHFAASRRGLRVGAAAIVTFLAAMAWGARSQSDRTVSSPSSPSALCGPNALRFLLAWFGDAITTEECVRETGCSRYGVSLAECERFLARRGYTTATTRFRSVAELRAMNAPMLVVLRGERPGTLHAWVVVPAPAGEFVVFDPPMTVRSATSAEIDARAVGVALVVSRGPSSGGDSP